MANLRNLVLLFVGILFVQTHAADKYTDQNRPYEFGFTIEGEQHRHEKKDENGIIMGEFGFITADGVYHVTVYATDENGNFKILSMKNIRVKPYPTSPRAGAGVKKSNSVASPLKDSIPESTKEEKTVKKQVASPAKSCSHCLLPTTTTTTTISPVTSKESAKFTDSEPPTNYNRNKNVENFNYKNPIPPQNIGDQQKDYNSKSLQSSTPTVVLNYPLEQKNKNAQNSELPRQNFGHQEPNIKPIPQAYPETIINNQNYPQQYIVSNSPVQAVAVDVVDTDQGGQQYFTPQNRPMRPDQQISNLGVSLNNPGLSQLGNIGPQPNENFHPISRSLQGPVNEDNFVPSQALVQNEQTDNGVKNYNQNNLNNNNNNYPEPQDYPQQQNYDEDSKVSKQNELPNSLPPSVITRQTTQPHNEDEQSTLGNHKGDRSPKSFGEFIQQSVGPEELVNIGPNLYRPSLPNSSEFSGKPILLAAQMQIVAKDTNIYNKNSGESEGLPDGITVDDMTNLLYTFNYTVGFHGHHEKGYSNGAKQGYYYVTGRNGVRTRVDYVADEKGFRPKITQEILDIASEEVPKPETEKDEKYGLKGYEFKWLYFPLDSKSV